MKILALILLMGCAGAQAAVTASPNDTVVKLGSTAAITDAAGNLWTITAGGQVAVGGVADTTTGAVTEIAYVNGVIWQENTSANWYSKTSPTVAWSAATTVSPLPVTYLAQATLTWAAPTANTNGTPITVPLTYNVYRGSSATTLTKLTNVSALTYVDPAGSATPTTYYYAVTAICAGCTESADSGVVSDTIAAPALTPGAPSGLMVH
jgi:hypothetical protein